MIRRRHGRAWLLITQTDHAALCGELARHIGSDGFESLRSPAVLGCQLHDAGWPQHDDLPTLNGQGWPLDVFEAPRPLSLGIWSTSAARAMDADLYAGLLVSLHSLALSALPEPPPTRFESSHMKERFETNKFQHKQIEEQENLRKQLQMRIDIPLTLGLANPRLDQKEDQLLFDFRWLQALDQLSLAICCSEPPFVHASIYPHPGERAMMVRFSRTGDGVGVNPWPFDEAELSCTLTGKVLPERKWNSLEDFRQAYRVAPAESLKIRITNGK